MKVQLHTEHLGWESNDFTKDMSANLADRKDFLAKVAEAHGVTSNEYSAVKDFECKMRISMVEPGYRELADLYFENSDGYQYGGTLDDCYKLFRFMHETYTATYTDNKLVHGLNIARVLHSATLFTDIFRATPIQLLADSGVTRFRQWEATFGNTEEGAGANMIANRNLHSGYIDYDQDGEERLMEPLRATADYVAAYANLRGNDAAWKGARAGIYELDGVFYAVYWPLKVQAVYADSGAVVKS